MNSDSLRGAIEQVKFAYSRTQFFRQYLEQANLSSSAIQELRDLKAVPTTTKVHYRSNYPSGVLAAGVQVNDPILHKSTSSGTAGDRLVTLADRFDLAERMGATISVHEDMERVLVGVRRQRVCRYAAPNCSDVECASPLVSRADRLLPDGTLVLPVAHDLLATPQRMVEQAIDEMQETAPHWLYIDPTHFAFLLRAAAKTGRSLPQVEAIVLTYTMATQCSRRQIAEFAGATPTAEVLSMSELGWVAMECPLGKLHLNGSSFYVEILGDDGEPVREGERGVAHLTSIGDHVLPHIRYCTGDVYTLLGRCECGHVHPAVRHEGRRREMLVLPDDSLVSGKDVDMTVGAPPGLELYQMEQINEERCEFRYLADDSFTGDEARALRQRLLGLLGPEIEVEMERVSYLPAQRSGKFASCTSAVAQERWPQ